MRALQKSISNITDQEYLKQQQELFQERQRKMSRTRGDSDSNDSGSDCENQTPDILNAPPQPQQTNQEEKKKKMDPFDISKPTVEETDGLIGLEDEKIFILAAIKGPVLFPLHQQRMRATSRLKGFMFYGPPVSILLIIPICIKLR